MFLIKLTHKKYKTVGFLTSCRSGFPYNLGTTMQAELGTAYSDELEARCMIDRVKEWNPQLQAELIPLVKVMFS